MKPHVEYAAIAVLSLAVLGLGGALYARSRVARSEEKPVPPPVAGTAATAMGEKPSADGAPTNAVRQASPAEVVARYPALQAISLSHGLPTFGHWRGKPALADLNGDGQLDLVASIRKWDTDKPGDGLHVWLGDGQGNWRLSIDGIRRDLSYGDAAVADVNQDGFSDLAFAAHSGMPQVFLGDGQGHWAMASDGIVTEGCSSSVAFGDVDGDGWCDLAALGFFGGNGGLQVFSGDGAGGWRKSAELMTVSDYGASVIADDIDGDKKPELLAATCIGPKMWKCEDGRFVGRSEGLPNPDFGGTDLAVATADLDGDGIKELLAAGLAYENHAPLVIYKWNGSRWDSWGDGLPTDISFNDACFAQIDGQGSPEIVLQCKAGILVLRQESPAHFEPYGLLSSAAGAVNVCAADLNHDGQDEIACVGFRGVYVFDVASARRPQ